MGILESTDATLDDRIAKRLKSLRLEHELSLDQLSEQCGISRATLSRLENAEVSPTASVLGKLCAAYGLTMSRLMMLVEQDYVALITPEHQPFWVDPETGFQRCSVSPPSNLLAGELLECTLPAGQRIAYETPPRPGLEHHLVLLDGYLQMTIGSTVHSLRKGDCLRYQLHGPSVFETPKNHSARYILAIL